MKVSLSVYGRFHAFNLARQLHRRGCLGTLVTSYPRFEVRKFGIPNDHVDSILWLELVKRGYFRTPGGLRRGDWLMPRLLEAFDRAARQRISEYVDLHVGWSGESEHTLWRAKSLGQVTVLERGSTHIVHQRDILHEEYQRLGLEPRLPHPSTVAKELREYEMADFICIPSQFARDTFLKQGLPAHKLIGAPYGVDLAQFSRRTDPREPFRLIYVGAMTIQKGVHYLLAAWAKARLAKAELWLVGSKSPEIEPFFDRYRGQFHFFGHVPQARLHKLYAQCSVFAMCSIQDGLAMVIPQALSCGLPVIATANSGAEDLLTDGIEGFVVPARDVDAMADRIRFFYEHPDAVTIMGARARRTAERRFNWDTYGDRMYATYKSILNRQASWVGTRATGDYSRAH